MLTEEQLSRLLQEKERLRALIEPAIFQFISFTGMMPQIDISERKITENTRCGSITVKEDFEINIKLIL